MDWRIFGGSGGPLKLFSDTMQRTTGIGPNWAVGYSDATQASFFSATGGLLLSLTGIRFSNSTGGGSSCSITTLPIILDDGVSGRNQFAEAKIAQQIGVASNGTDAGPGVMLQTGDPSNNQSQTGYDIFVSPNFALSIVQSNVVERVVLSRGGAGTQDWVVGDTVRLSVVIGSSSNALTLWKNGAVIATVTDNNATRPTSGGIPGFFWRGSAVAQGLVFSNFRGGVGNGS